MLGHQVYSVSQSQLCRESPSFRSVIPSSSHIPFRVSSRPPYGQFIPFLLVALEVGKKSHEDSHVGAHADKHPVELGGPCHQGHHPIVYHLR